MRIKGFTYIGLLILIAILGITTAATINAGSVLQRRNAEDELLFVGLQFRLAFQQYYESTPSGQRRYPTTISDLLKDPRYPNVRRYLRKIYVDPITGQADWAPVPAPEGGIMGVKSRSDSRPIKIANFPDEFKTFENSSKYSDWVFFYR